MNRVVKAIALSFILFIYSIALSYFGLNSYAADSVQSDNQACHIYDSFSNTAYFFLNQQSEDENSVERTNTVPTPVRKSHHNNAYASTKPIESEQIRTFNRLDSYQSHIAIQFKETDIVFPFHFFF